MVVKYFVGWSEIKNSHCEWKRILICKRNDLNERIIATITHRPFSFEWWYQVTCWFFKTSGIRTKHPKWTLCP